jgi:hypothetical protein
MRTLHITTYDELRQVDHRAVIVWKRIMRGIDQAEPSTIRDGVFSSAHPR